MDINKNVDIIIPIYNAADDLEKCLKSIYKNTDLTKNRLILINDNSPDPRIKEILDSQRKDHVIVIHNSQNQGFSANINIGMSQSTENDVILLNSDTVVTERWVDKMVACAYSSHEIGTVTPLSNNATLCSVPEFCEENVLPENIDVDKMGKLVEHCSMRRYPRISVAHGFCMLIKREVINLIGNFDAETFGRGYGEENDFCNRAEQVGFIHVQCDDTFILHTGSSSFESHEKAAYIREHDAILRKRYPQQMLANDIYVKDNPNGYVQENIRIFMDLENGKKNILFVVHSDFRKDSYDNVGGTQLHVCHLKEHMTEDYNVFVAARNGEYLNLTLYTDQTEHFWKFYIGEYKGYFRFNDRKLDEIWNMIFDAFGFDIVHIHHIYSLSFDIFYCAFNRHVPVILTCHDYYFVSPIIKLLDADYNVIDKENMTDVAWRKSLDYLEKIYPGIDYINIWQKKCLEVLAQCTSIIAPNITVKENISKFYPEVVGKISVVEHGYEFAKPQGEIIVEGVYTNYYIESVKETALGSVIEGWVSLDDAKDEIDNIYLDIKSGSRRLRLPTSIESRYDIANSREGRGKYFKTLIPKQTEKGKWVIDLLVKAGRIIRRKRNVCEIEIHEKKNKLNIGFIGGLCKEKGADTICELIRKNTPNVNYYVFGNLGHEMLSAMKTNNAYMFGHYDSNDLRSMLHCYNIDIVCILSIWPETFSYTLSEALMCGVPVIVSDIGALGERMTHFENVGWRVSLDNTCEQIVDIIGEISKDASILSSKKEAIKKISFKTLRDMAREYKDLYEKFSKDKTRQIAAFDAEKLYKKYVQRNYFLKADAEVNKIYEALTFEEKECLNSLTFKIADKVRRIKFPFKTQIKLAYRNNNHNVR